MIKAEMTISTCYGNALIPVAVIGRGPRLGTVWVRALNGLEPFTKASHGGPYQDSISVVLIPNIRDIHFENDPEKELVEVQPQPSDQHIQAGLFLESANRLYTQLPKGGGVL
jgi:hypothetical protein